MPTRTFPRTSFSHRGPISVLIVAALVSACSDRKNVTPPSGGDDAGDSSVASTDVRALGDVAPTLDARDATTLSDGPRPDIITADVMRIDVPTNPDGSVLGDVRDSAAARIDTGPPVPMWPFVVEASTQSFLRGITSDGTYIYVVGSFAGSLPVDGRTFMGSTSLLVGAFDVNGTRRWLKPYLPPTVPPPGSGREEGAHEGLAIAMASDNQTLHLLTSASGRLLFGDAGTIGTRTPEGRRGLQLQLRKDGFELAGTEYIAQAPAAPRLDLVYIATPPDRVIVAGAASGEVSLRGATLGTMADGPYGVIATGPNSLTPTLTRRITTTQVPGSPFLGYPMYGMAADADGNVVVAYMPIGGWSMDFGGGVTSTSPLGGGNNSIQFVSYDAALGTVRWQDTSSSGAIGSVGTIFSSSGKLLTCGTGSSVSFGTGPARMQSTPAAGPFGAWFARFAVTSTGLTPERLTEIGGAGINLTCRALAERGGRVAMGATFSNVGSTMLTLGGTTHTVQGASDIIVAVLDDAGVVTTAFSFGGPDQENLTGLSWLNDTTLCFTGWTQGEVTINGRRIIAPPPNGTRAFAHCVNVP